jgi:DEAD/DEAH box helicase domain-containing protein
MAQINALALIARIKRRMVDFALDDHYVSDPELQAVCERIWSGPPEQGGLASDLWVEAAFPSTTARETMRDIVERGDFDRELAGVLDAAGYFPLDRHPYSHQLTCLQRARASYAAPEKSSIILTAGTGAGKTESFLLPLLDDLYRHPPPSSGGISALILYPMNALVNDQVERLYEWLRSQTRVTLFHFTSETPENKDHADRRNIPRWDACRIRTRQQARGLEDANGRELAADQRGIVPQILITNYSMLEYMLCRPQDAVFFGPNLRTVVLDEAHLYTGNLAAEITLLLRRVLTRCDLSSDNVTQIATSATLGSGHDTERELSQFASRLFGKPRDRIHVIQGTPHREDVSVAPAALPASTASSISRYSWPDGATLTDTAEGPIFASCTAEEWETWSTGLGLICSQESVERAFAATGERHIAPILWNLLRQSPLIAAIQEILYPSTRLPLSRLASQLFGADGHPEQEATRQLLRLAASARIAPSEYPLLPNRIHFLIRAPEGLCFSFAPNHPETARMGVRGLGYVFAPSRLTIIPPDDRIALTIVREETSGEWFLAGVRSEGRLNEVPPALTNPTGTLDPTVEFYSLTEVAGAERWLFNPVTGELSGEGGEGFPLWAVRESPRTGDLLSEHAHVLGSQTRLQISLLAETALMEMPPILGDTNLWKPARGRRLLVFSDSRSEAARLGPRLTRQHELQLFRAAVAETVQRAGASSGVLDFLRSELSSRQARLAAGGLDRSLEIYLGHEITELEQRIQNQSAGGSLAYWQQQLAASTRLAEFFDPGSAQRHDARTWSQTAWEANLRHIQEHVSGLLGRELARQARWPDISLETTGLIEVVYPGLELIEAPGSLLGRLPTEAMREQLRQVWRDMVAFVLDELRTLGAVTLGSAEEDDSYQFGGAFIGKWVSLENRYRSDLFPLLSVAERSRIHIFVTTVMMRLGSPEAEASELARIVLTEIFHQLRTNAGQALPWLRMDERDTGTGAAATGLRVDFRGLALRKPLTLFRCSRSGEVRPRHVLGCSPGARNAALVPVTESELLQDRRIARARREWLDSPVFHYGLWAEEHSAQLSPTENLRLQNLFKAGIRNILSSTTTMELGIDIGGLNGVLMANIPPGKANYLQRAGRAGRRADGSSVVIGFARAVPYEREVFLHFGDYLDEPLRRPTVFLERERIARRHAQAWLLGEFFRAIHGPGRRTGAMTAFGCMGMFCRKPLPGYWAPNQPKPELHPPIMWALPSGNEWLPAEADQLGFDDLFIRFLAWVRDHSDERRRSRLASLWEGTNLNCTGNAWGEQIERFQREFTRAFSQWKGDYDTLLHAWEAIGVDEAHRINVANALHFQLKTFHELTVIEALGDALVLPRYGFPIGISRLRVVVPGEGRNSERTREEDQFRLQRDSMMALREYVPGAQLLVGGQLVTSRGILKHWTGQDISGGFMLRGTFQRSNGGHFLYSTTAIPEIPEEIRNRHQWDTGRLFFPRFGFTSAAWDPPKFSNDFEYVGRVRAYTTGLENSDETETFVDFAQVVGLNAKLRNGGEILLMNEADHAFGFAVCLKCGYAEGETIPGGEGRRGLSSSFEHHASLFAVNDRRRCWSQNETPVLRNEVLAARQITNLIQLDLSRWLHRSLELDTQMAITLAQALRLAGCRLLQIDIREVRALDPVPVGLDGLAIVLYDSVAGGSGHVEDLLRLGRAWMEQARAQLDVRSEGIRSREREALRRLLTADSVGPSGEVAYRPMETLNLLQGILGGLTPPRPEAPPPEVTSRPPNLDALRDRAQAARSRRRR